MVQKISFTQQLQILTSYITIVNYHIQDIDTDTILLTNLQSLFKFGQLFL